jgi:predicted RNA methylase
MSTTPDELDDLLAGLPSANKPAARKPARPPKQRTTEEHLELLRQNNAGFADVAQGFMDFARARGVDPIIRSGYRDPEEQNWLHLNGRPTKGNDGYVRISPHQQSRAIDWGVKDPSQKQSLYTLLKAYARKRKLHIPADEPWHLAGPAAPGVELSSKANNQLDDEADGDELDDLLASLPAATPPGGPPDRQRAGPSVATPQGPGLGVVGAAKAPEGRPAPSPDDDLAMMLGDLPSQAADPLHELQHLDVEPLAPIKQEARRRRREPSPALTQYFKTEKTGKERDRELAERVARDLRWHFGINDFNDFLRLPAARRQSILELTAKAVAEDERKKARGDEIAPSLEYQNAMRRRVGLGPNPGMIDPRVPRPAPGAMQDVFADNRAQREQRQSWQQARTRAIVTEELEKGPQDLQKRLRQRGIDPGSFLSKGFLEQNTAEQLSPQQQYLGLRDMGLSDDKIKGLGLKVFPDAQQPTAAVSAPTGSAISHVFDGVFADDWRETPTALRHGATQGLAGFGQIWAGAAQIASTVDPTGFMANFRDAMKAGMAGRLNDIQVEKAAQAMDRLIQTGESDAALLTQVNEQLGAALPTVIKYAGVATMLHTAGFSASMPATMGLVSAVENADKPATKQLTELGKNIAMGYVLHATAPLGRGPAAAAFGGISGVEAGLHGEPVVPAVISGAVVGGALANPQGVRAMELPGVVLRAAVRNPATPEPVRDLLARLGQYEKGVVYSDDGRAVSIYKDPATGEWFGQEVTPEQAKQYDPTIVTGEKRPIRENAAAVTSAEYDRLLTILNIETRGSKPRLEGEVEGPGVPPEVKDVTPPPAAPQERRAVERTDVAEIFSPEQRADIVRKLSEMSPEDLAAAQQMLAGARERTGDAGTIPTGKETPPVGGNVGEGGQDKGGEILHQQGEGRKPVIPGEGPATPEVSDRPPLEEVKRVTFKVRGKDLEGEIVREYTTSGGTPAVDVRVGDKTYRGINPGVTKPLQDLGVSSRTEKSATEPSAPESPLLDRKLEQYAGQPTLRDFAQKEMPDVVEIARRSATWREFQDGISELGSDPQRDGPRGGQTRELGGLMVEFGPTEVYEALRSLKASPPVSEPANKISTKPTQPPQSPTAPPVTPPLTTGKPALSDDAKAAIERMRKKLGKPPSGMPATGPQGFPEVPTEGEAPGFGEDDILDGALVGHELFKAGIRDQETWTAQMKELVSDAIESFLPDIWESAVIQHEGEGLDVSDLAEWTAPAPKPAPKEPEPPAPPTKEEKPVDEDKGLVPGTSRLMIDIRDRLIRGEPTTWRQLDELADLHFGGSRAEGKYTPRDMYDAVEAALAGRVMAWSRGILTSDPQESLRQLRKMVANLPTQTSRQDEQIQRQQFSTPPTIGLAAATALDIQPADIGLEPSAGTGLLAAFLKAMGAKEVHVNEIAPRRRALLDRQGYSSVNSVDAQRLNALLPQKIRPTVILMNPPFSTQEGIQRHDTRYGLDHMLSALQRLADGGRLVAIMGESAQFNREATVDSWNKILSRYNVRANIAIPGKEYAKFGTHFGTQLVVIDKHGRTPGGNFAEMVGHVRQDAPADLEGVLDVIKELPKRQQLVESDRPGDKPVTGDGSGREGGSAGPPQRPGTGGPPETPGPRVESPTTDVTGPVQPPTETESPTRKSDGEGTERAGDSGGAGTESGGRVEPGEPPEDSGIEYDTEAAKTESESDIFVQYQPAKLKGGKEHPGRIVESSSMAAVEPPDITYKPDLPASIIKKGILSNLQLEAVTYAGQRHEQKLPDGRRAAYFIGDGTGVGKGREAAGVALDNWRRWTKQKKQRRILWLSVNYDLVESAERDMKALLELPPDADLTEHFPFHILNDFSPGDELDELAGDGMMFATYSTLIATGQAGAVSRFKDLTAWLGEDGLIIFDEAHKAKNAIGAMGMGGTQTGERVIQLQEGKDSNPNWKILYMSATGATEVRNMAYMSRLGLWGPGLSFHDFDAFQQAIDAGGLGAMEMVARDMKALGQYRAVTLSYKGVTYRDLVHDLTEGQVDVYNGAARAWQTVADKVEEAMIEQRPNSRTKSLVLSQFYSGQQRFFRQVLTAMKLPTILQDVERVLREGIDYEHPDTKEVKKLPVQVILGFIYTGESQTSREVTRAKASGDSLEDLDFSPAHILRGFVDRYFPTQLFQDVPNVGGNGTHREPVFDEEGNPVHDPELVRMKREVLQELEGLTLPENPLDQVINHFGEDKVAELSGRSHRMIRNPDTGVTEYNPRLGTDREGRKTSQKRANEHEMEDYQAGLKRIAIITDAASTGITLSADLTSPSKDARRVHYTVETAWSADKMMQTLGRGHRTNQGSEPEMVLAGSNVGGEGRFLATIAKRMGSLGALSKGERKATGSTFDNYDFENEYGVTTARTIMATLNDRQSPPPYAGAPEDFEPMEMARKMGFAKRQPDGTLKIKERDVDTLGVGKFLNRVLALELHDQEVMFKWFIGLLDRVIAKAKEEGTFDTGVADIEGESVRMVGEPTVVARDQTTGAPSHHVVIESDEPIEKVSFDDTEMMAAHRPRSYQGPGFKYWMQQHSHNVVFVTPGSARTDAKTGNITQYYHVIRPGGRSDTLISGSELVEKYTEVDELTKLPLREHKGKKLKPAETAARMKMRAQLEATGGKGGPQFDVPKPETVREWWNREFLEAHGFKTKTYHLITSPVIPVWDRLSTRKDGGRATNLKAMRATTDDGTRVVGIHIPTRHIKQVLRALGVGASKRSPEEIFNALYLDNEQVELVGGLRLRRTTLRGSRAIELWGVNYETRKAVLDMGVIHERKGMGNDIYLVPTEASKGIPVIEKILKRWPPFDAQAAAETDLSDMAAEGEIADIEGGQGMPDVTQVADSASRGSGSGSPESQREADEQWREEASQTEAPDLYAPQQETEDLDQYEARVMARISGIADWDIRMNPEAGFENAKTSTADVRNEFLKMFDALGHAIDIRAGRMGRYRNALGLHWMHRQMIRLRNAWNIPVMSHEAGHALQHYIYGSSQAAGIKHLPIDVRRELIKLGKDLYGATKPAGGYSAEGFAEFMRYYLTTEEAPTRAPKMVQFFETQVLPKDTKLAKALPKVRQKIDEYRFQGEHQRSRAQMESKEKTIAQRVQDVVASLKQGRTDWIDELQPLMDWSRTFEEITGRKLDTAEDPFKIADFYRGAGNHVLRYMLEKQMVDGALNPVGKSFDEAVVAPIRNAGKHFGMHPVELLGHYLWALRAIERWSSAVLAGEASGGAAMFTPLKDVGSPTHPRLAPTAKERKDPGKSLEQAIFLKQSIEQAMPEIHLSAAGWYEWWDGVMNYIMEVNPDLAPTLKRQIRTSAFYAPLQRAFDEIQTPILGKKRPFTGQGKLLRMKGSQRRVMNVMLQTFLNVERMLTNAHKHRVLTAITDLEDTPGIGKILERVPRQLQPQNIELEKIRKQLEDIGIDTSGARGDEILTYFLPMQQPGGQDPIMPVVTGNTVEWVYVPVELYNALSGLDIYRPDKTLMIAAGYYARLFRLGTTGVRASFGLFTNPFRDVTTWFGQSQVKTNNPAERFNDYMHGMASIFGFLLRHRFGTFGKIKELDELYDLFERLPVKMSQPLGYDIATTRHEAKRLFRPRGKEIVKRPFERLVTATPIDFLRELFGVPEAFPRIAEMRGIMREIGYVPGTPMTFEQALVIALAGKQATVDFLAAGKKGKVANQIVPFFNPNIQGNRSFARAFRRSPLQALLRGLGITLATLLLWWLNKDKDWYRDLKPYERFAYWNIEVPGEEVFQIPRAQEWGTIFATIPEALLDAAYRDDPEEATKAMQHIFDVLTPPVLPVPLHAAIEQAANYNEFFQKPIVPKAMEDDPPLEQQTEYTSEVAKFIAERLPDARIPYLNIPLNSPLRIDAAIREFGGGAAADLANAPRTARAAGRAVAGAFGYGEKGQDYELSDLPVVGRGFRRGGTTGTGSPMLDKFYSRLRDARLLAQSKREEETPQQREARLNLESAQVAIVALRQAGRAEQNKTRRREIYATINDIAARAVKGEQVYKPKKDTDAMKRKRERSKARRTEKQVERWLGEGADKQYEITRPER